MIYQDGEIGKSWIFKCFMYYDKRFDFDGIGEVFDLGKRYNNFFKRLVGGSMDNGCSGRKMREVEIIQ